MRWYQIDTRAIINHGEDGFVAKVVKTPCWHMCVFYACVSNAFIAQVNYLDLKSLCTRVHPINEEVFRIEKRKQQSNHQMLESEPLECMFDYQGMIQMTWNYTMDLQDHVTQGGEVELCKNLHWHNHVFYVAVSFASFGGHKMSKGIQEVSASFHKLLRLHWCLQS